VGWLGGATATVTCSEAGKQAQHPQPTTHATYTPDVPLQSCEACTPPTGRQSRSPRKPTSLAGMLTSLLVAPTLSTLWGTPRTSQVGCAAWLDTGRARDMAPAPPERTSTAAQTQIYPPPPPCPSLLLPPISRRPCRRAGRALWAPAVCWRGRQRQAGHRAGGAPERPAGGAASAGADTR
jgi:hypothetical protein